MTRDQVVALIKTTMDIYPNFKPHNLTSLADSWHMILSSYDIADIQNGFKTFVTYDTSGFAPSVGQLIQSIPKVSEINAQEAWQIVRKAIRNSSYYAEEEFAKLPPLIQKSIGGKSKLRDLAVMEKVNWSVEESNFIKTYRAECERKDVALVHQKLGINEQLKLEGK